MRDGLPGSRRFAEAVKVLQMRGEKKKRGERQNIGQEGGVDRVQMGAGCSCEGYPKGSLGV